MSAPILLVVLGELHGSDALAEMLINDARALVLGAPDRVRACAGDDFTAVGDTVAAELIDLATRAAKESHDDRN